MNLNFTKLSPGGNDTIIVQSDVLPTERASIARKLMSTSFTGGEQVGYLSIEPRSGIDGRLDMMGGEFCVNALRSAATVLSSDSGKTNVRLASSGTDEVFEFVCVPQKGAYYTSITLNLNPRIKSLAQGTLLVHLDGISHLLCEFAPEATVEPLNVFAELRQRYDIELRMLPAFGIIPYQTTKEGYSIYPVVYVRETNTTIPESGCGSGSIALALALDKFGQALSVIQPSGSKYIVDVTRTTESVKVTLSSEVSVLLTGTAYL